MPRQPSIQVYGPAELWEQLEQEAERKGISQSALAKEYIRRGLQREHLENEA